MSSTGLMTRVNSMAISTACLRHQLGLPKIKRSPKDGFQHYSVVPPQSPLSTREGARESHPGGGDFVPKTAKPVYCMRAQTISRPDFFDVQPAGEFNELQLYLVRLRDPARYWHQTLQSCRIGSDKRRIVAAR